MQSGASFVASRTPLQLEALLGARQRSGPMGGAANGTPKHCRVAAPTVPQRSAPESVLTISLARAWQQPANSSSGSGGSHLVAAIVVATSIAAARRTSAAPRAARRAVGVFFLA